MPYLVLKVLWTFDVPVGIADRSVLDSSGWVAANALMAVVELAGLLLVLGLTRSWARRAPTWLLLFPMWVGTGLLFQVVVGAALMGASSASSGESAETGEFQPWVFAIVYPSVAVQGVALAIAFASHVRARWGHLLGERTGTVVAWRTAGVRSWPERRLAGMAEAVAGMAVAVAGVCGYWAAGGSFGDSRVSLDVPWGMNASRAVGAVVAAVGLLGLAGRWGERTPLWLPASLTWFGSGALAAFDGLAAVLASLLLGTDASAPAWGLTDTVLVIKVVIGMLAGALGALAVKVASKDNYLERADPERVEVQPVETAPGAAEDDCEPKGRTRGLDRPERWRHPALGRARRGSTTRS
jgi:hypothetical protein